MTVFDPHILSDLRCGRMLILVDGKDRENEGDLVCAAEKITPKTIAFMAKFGRGLICVPLTPERARKLDLQLMSPQNTTRFGCQFTVSVDAKKSTTTGISAFDRAASIRVLSDEKSKPEDLIRPGHIFPLIAQEGGLAVRAGHTEGSVELMKRAGLKPVAVICEIMGDDGHMLTGKKLERFARKHRIRMAAIQSLGVPDKKPPRKQIPLLELMVESRLPTVYGEFQIKIYRDPRDGKEHMALTKGNVTDTKPPLVRIHSECFTGDVLCSVRCDCHKQLHLALRAIAKERRGVLVYLRQEGRGIGLINKLRAYNLQDQGYDTIDANEKLGFSADLRDYSLAAFMLCDIGVSRMRLMTNNPEKIEDLEKAGLKVMERIPLEISAKSEGEIAYLRAKKMKMGHFLSNV